MNIFYVDTDPRKAAQALCDKHVVKMVLESAQLLCTAISEASQGDIETPYRPTHKNHPCTKWARLSPDNFDWLYRHAIALCEEYTFRYGKRHKSQDIIEWCKKNQITNLMCWTEPPQAMPDEYRNDDPVTAYRNYYIQDKMKNIQCEWNKGRPQPEWIK